MLRLHPASPEKWMAIYREDVYKDDKKLTRKSFQETQSICEHCFDFL